MKDIKHHVIISRDWECVFIKDGDKNIMVSLEIFNDVESTVRDMPLQEQNKHFLSLSGKTDSKDRVTYFILRRALEGTAVPLLTGDDHDMYEQINVVETLWERVFAQAKKEASPLAHLRKMLEVPVVFEGILATRSEAYKIKFAEVWKSCITNFIADEESARRQQQEEREARDAADAAAQAAANAAAAELHAKKMADIKEQKKIRAAADAAKAEEDAKASLMPTRLFCILL